MKLRDASCLLSTCALLAAAISTANAQSTVYRWIDENGVVHFGDAPPDAATGIESEAIPLPDVQTSFRPLPPPLAATPTVESGKANIPASAPATSSTPVPSLSFEECSDASPTISAGQDLYEISAEPDLLEPQDIDLLRRVIGTMQGRWQGPDTGFYCLERGAVDEKRPFDRTIEAEGDLNPPDRFVLDSRIQSQGSNRRELLRIEIRDRTLVVNSDTASLIDVSDRELDFGTH